MKKSAASVRGASVLTAGLATLLLFGCGDSGSPSTPTTASEAGVIPPAWYATVSEQYEKAGNPSSVPTIETDATCAFDATVKVDGKGLQGFGTGASSVGDTGRRYQCNYLEPSSYLVVGTFTTAADYTEVTDTLKAKSQPGNEQTEETFTLAGRTIRVVRTVYPTNASHIDYAASVVDPVKKAYALLSIETTDELKSTYTSQQAADDFSSVLGG